MKQKRGFLLLSVIILLVTFSYLSISIIQNQTFSSQIDKLKYLEIQAKIHIGTIEKYINEIQFLKKQVNAEKLAH